MPVYLFHVWDPFIKRAKGPYNHSYTSKVDRGFLLTYYLQMALTIQFIWTLLRMPGNFLAFYL